MKKQQASILINSVLIGLLLFYMLFISLVTFERGETPPNPSKTPAMAFPTASSTFLPTNTPRPTEYPFLTPTAQSTAFIAPTFAPTITPSQNAIEICYEVISVTGLRVREGPTVNSARIGSRNFGEIFYSSQEIIHDNVYVWVKDVQTEGYIANYNNSWLKEVSCLRINRNFTFPTPTPEYTGLGAFPISTAMIEDCRYWEFDYDICN